MKIFNLEPIKVNEYIINNKYLAESCHESDYESGFDFMFDKVDALYTLTLEFDIRYTVRDEGEEIIELLEGPNKFLKHISFEFGKGDIILSYNISSQFNFENEGFDADVLSLIDFLEKFYLHIKLFISQAGFEVIKKAEEKERMNYPLRGEAVGIIDNLRANNMYEF